jgi:hypothetical protein
VTIVFWWHFRLGFILGGFLVKSLDVVDSGGHRPVNNNKTSIDIFYFFSNIFIFFSILGGPALYTSIVFGFVAML